MVVMRKKASKTKRSTKQPDRDVRSVMREIYVKIIFSFSEISNFQHMICILKTFL